MSRPTRSTKRRRHAAALVAALLLAGTAGAGAAEAATAKHAAVRPAASIAQFGTLPSTRWSAPVWVQRDGVGVYWRVTRVTRNGYRITRFEGYSCLLSCVYEGPTYVRTVGRGHTFWFLLVAGRLIPVTD